MGFALEDASASDCARTAETVKTCDDLSADTTSKLVPSSGSAGATPTATLGLEEPGGQITWTSERQ